jgi:hypothetical protein
MNNEEVTNISKSWISLQLAEKDSPEYDSEFWSFERLDQLIHNKPNEALRVIIEIAVTTDSEEILGYLGAGPIEDLMLYHGEQVIENLAAKAKAEPKIKVALQSVQIEKEDTKAWGRFYEIAGIEPYE